MNLASGKAHEAGSPDQKRPGYGALWVMVIAVPVMVNVAVRAGPVLAATANCTTPSPVPEAPCVTVRNEALLVAVQAHCGFALTEIDDDPPAAEYDVVVVPVMMSQFEGLLGSSSSQAMTATSSTAETMSRVRADRRRMSSGFMRATIACSAPDTPRRPEL